MNKKSLPIYSHHYSPHCIRLNISCSTTNHVSWKKIRCIGTFHMHTLTHMGSEGHKKKKINKMEQIELEHDIARSRKTFIYLIFFFILHNQSFPLLLLYILHKTFFCTRGNIFEIFKKNTKNTII